MVATLPGTTALRRFSPAVMALLLVNIIPVAGVLFQDWSIFEVLLVFWAENVVIGIVNVVKILTVSTIGKKYSGLAVIPFFIFHYGLFTLGHGVLIFAIFGDGTYFEKGSVAGGDMEYMRGLFLPGGLLFIPTISLFMSHFMSYLINFIGRKEYANPENLMFQPYGRVVVLHLATLLGGALVEFLGAPILALLLLITLKIVLDLGAHLSEHNKPPKKEASAP